MPKILYLEMPLKPQHSKNFEELCKSEEGFSETKKQSGWISTEWMISESAGGGTIFHMWEQWRSQKDFEDYMQTPKRSSGSNFERAVISWAAGEVRMVWGNVIIE